MYTKYRNTRRPTFGELTMAVSQLTKAWTSPTLIDRESPSTDQCAVEEEPRAVRYNSDPTRRGKGENSDITGRRVSGESKRNRTGEGGRTAGANTIRDRENSFQTLKQEVHSKRHGGMR